MIEIISRGFSSIQDVGRYGFRQKGIPCAGAMDQDAYELVNNALGNSKNTPVIEYWKTGLIVQAAVDCQCMIIGQVSGISLNRVPVKLGRLIELKTGDVLHTGKVLGGTFAYLGFSGEYVGLQELGSASEGIGVLTHEMRDFSFSPKKLSSSFAGIKPKLKSEHIQDLTVYPGPEYHALLAEAKNELQEKTYHLSRETWRMAFKLQEKLVNDLPSIASAPVLPGTIQLTPSGEIVILMRDAQTTGGYPRILQLTEDSINKICRVGWGGGVRFQVIKK